MRHKYETRGIVLSRSPAGETNALVTLVTAELGLVRAHAQGVRRSGAKLAAALATYAESSLVLVRGKEGWRVAGSVLEENWFARLQAEDRARASRVANLFLRLVAGEERDTGLFPIIRGLFEALASLPESDHDAAEALAVLRALSALGLDTGGFPEGESAFAAPLLAEIGRDRPVYIARINRGIAASGL